MSPTGGDTVFDRTKRTGYMMGSNHPMNRMESMSPLAPNAQAGGPPNHRDSGSEGISCGDCQQFDGEQCGKFGVPTSTNMLCDEHEPVAEDESAVPPLEPNQITG